MDEIDRDEVAVPEDTDLEEPTVPESEEPEEEPTKVEPKAEKPKETPEQKVARLERQLQRARKEAGAAEEPKQPEAKSGLDDRDLDYLDLKGITNEEDIELIESVMQKTGKNAREALKDDYVTAMLKANGDRRAVKEATPSSTKRGGETGDMLVRDLAAFEKSGTIPEDYSRRTAMFDALESRSNPNRPSWHR